MIAGRYRLEREIGRGGSGTVHLALDEVLGRQVAIKRIGATHGSGDVERERAEREARLAAALNHPHVVSVFDLVDEADVRWLVMEYVDGETLNEKVRREGPLAADDAATLLGQTADALVEAHANGIVHRDVKPSNILIADGGAKLNDFGIARSENDASLTQTGLVTGSPAYLAPEVASGSSATPASDVWSLGATLYHAVTGKPPYDVGDNLIGALYKIVHEDPPRLAPEHRMAGLLTVMMTHDPDQRWSMQQVRDDLVRISRGEPSRASADTVGPARVPERERTGTIPVVRPAPLPRAARPRRRHWGWIAVAAVAAVAAVMAAYVLAGRGTPEAAPDDSTESSQTSASETPDAGANEPTAAEVRQQMDDFIASYLDTVTTDPEAAFEQLTPAFQAASGDYEGYIGWWSKVRSAELKSVESNPADQTVAYTVTYQMKSGAQSTQRIRLQLQRDGDDYLIANEV